MGNYRSIGRRNRWPRWFQVQYKPTQKQLDPATPSEGLRAINELNKKKGKKGNKKIRQYSSMTGPKYKVNIYINQINTPPPQKETDPSLNPTIPVRRKAPTSNVLIILLYLVMF